MPQRGPNHSFSEIAGMRTGTVPPGAGMKWNYVNALGTSAYIPYGWESQNVFATMKANASFNSTVEHLILGAQTTGSSSLFFMNTLATASTGIALAADWISQAPYTQANATAFTTTVPRTQDISALAEVWYNGTNASPMGVMGRGQLPGGKGRLRNSTTAWGKAPEATRYRLR